MGRPRRSPHHSDTGIIHRSISPQWACSYPRMGPLPVVFVHHRHHRLFSKSRHDHGREACASLLHSSNRTAASPAGALGFVEVPQLAFRCNARNAFNNRTNHHHPLSSALACKYGLRTIRIRKRFSISSPHTHRI